MTKDVDRIEDFDFGFSFSDEQVDNLKNDLSIQQNELEDIKDRLSKLHNAIIPFLDNLCRDPDKATIHWPNRVEKIQDYKKKLQRIVEGKN
jgi:hypothetical protein